MEKISKVFFSTLLEIYSLEVTSMKNNILTIFATFIFSISAFAQTSNLLSASAKAEVGKENFEPCIAEMSKLIQLKPKNDAAFFERGRCLFFSASGERGYEKIRAAKAKTISDADKLIEATNIEYDSRRTRSIDDATQAIALNPKNAAAYNLRGLVTLQVFTNDSEIKAKRSASAIDDFNQALKIDPKFVKAYVNRGMELYGNSDYEAAFADFKKASELEPKNEMAAKLLVAAEKKIKLYETRADDCLKTDQAYLCVPDLKRYAELHPNSAKAFFDLARVNNSVEIYTDVQDRATYWKDAEAAYLKTIKLNPTGIEAYLELFDLYKEKLRNKVNAKVVAIRAVENFPLDQRSYILRGRAYESEQNWTEAIADFSRAVKFAPNYSKAYERRSNSYAGLKQFDLALADLNKAVELDGSNGSAYFTRGNFYNFQNKLNEAIADFTSADKLNVTCAKTARGAVYTKIAVNNKEPRDSSNYAKAKQDFLADDARKCFDTNYQFGVMLFSQGFLKEADEQFNLATSAYKKFGYNTAQIEKFRETIKSLDTLATSPNPTQEKDTNITKILNKLKESPVQNGAELVSTGSADFNTISVTDLYRYPKKGEIYYFAVVSENDPNLSVNLITRDSGKSDYKSTYDTSKVSNYSVVIVTVNVVREMLTLTFEAKGNGKLHWILYRKK